MAIKKREARTSSPASTSQDELDEKAAKFGKGGYAPEAENVSYDPHAPVGPQGILFRFNDYQKQLLKDSAAADRRSQQKLLESIVWPELERRKASQG